jgi:hypothetical protein
VPSVASCSPAGICLTAGAWKTDMRKVIIGLCKCLTGNSASLHPKIYRTRGLKLQCIEKCIHFHSVWSNLRDTIWNENENRVWHVPTTTHRLLDNTCAQHK